MEIHVSCVYVQGEGQHKLVPTAEAIEILEIGEALLLGVYLGIKKWTMLVLAFMLHSKNLIRYHQNV